jgi:hypothetical protein
MSVGDRSLHFKVSTWSPVESIREEMSEGELVVVLIVRNVEVVAENTAI